MTTHPEYAGDATPLGEAVARFEAEGFTGQFGAREGGQVICFSCHTESPAERVELVGLIRAEGASDPDDMVAIAALVCPHCGAKGTVVLKFGPEASPEEDDVLERLSDERVATGTEPSDC